MSASEKSPGEGRGAREAIRVAGIGALSVLGAVMLYNVFVAFADQVLNGVFIGWVSATFLNVHNLNEFGISAGIALDIVGTRYFFFQLGVCVAAAIALAAVVAARLSARRARREERARAAALRRI